MNAVLEAEFNSLLLSAARDHASQIFIRLAGERAEAVATISGGDVVMADWPAERALEILPAAFGLCDSADPYAPGSARTVQMTGQNNALPAGIRSILVQFLPPRDGGRVLVARITREGDTCCGTCGG